MTAEVSDWLDAADGRHGAQRTVWGILKVMERFKYRAGEEDLGAVALVLEMTKALERVSLLVVWAWATHFNFQKKILLFAFVGILNTRGECSSKDVWRSPSRLSRPSCQCPTGVVCFYAPLCRMHWQMR